MSKLCLVVCLLGPLAAVQAGRMEVLYSWSQVDFIFPSNLVREYFLSTGQFIPKNNAILDVDIWGGHRGVGRKVLVTLPKFKDGVPVTLAMVTDQRRNNSALLAPYPDWSWHDGTCDAITSVYRTQVDKCGRLWVLDCGAVNTLGEPRRVCPPQILVFDLLTDRLIHRHRFPSSLLDDESLLITIKVDSRADDCSDSMAYVSDVLGFKLLVHDPARDESWQVTNNLFYPYPLYGDFHVNGVDFDLMDGIFGMALGPILNNGDRTLYFHSFASVHESWVSASVVRNRSLFTEDNGASPRSFQVSEGTRQSQSTVEDMTDSGIMFYAMVEDNSIGCWNTRLPFKKQNLEIVAKDDVTLQFQSGLKVYGNLVWSLSSRLQNYIVDKVPEGEANYRINVGRVSDLVRHTRCDVPGHRPRVATPPEIVFP